MKFKKIFLELYFIFFIILNIIDFLNIIPSDLDIFKKFLSWILIGYIIYKASITNILIGNKNKKIDFILVLIGYLMDSLKDLQYYLSNINVSEFTFFRSLVYFLKEIIKINFVSNAFYIGLIILFLISINLTKKKIYPNSFINSFLNDDKKNMFSNIKKFLLIYFFLIFFILTIYNFFMEWFALAIDSAILVIGLIYYLLLMINKHIYRNEFDLLNNISNTGNSFYLNLINLLSNKKTFFISLSLLLTIHLLVDLGVFFLPYLIGLKNSLYGINIEGSNILPVFNFFDLKKSIFYHGLEYFNNFLPSIFSLIPLIIHIFLILYFIITCLISPFYILYSFFNKSKIYINKNLLKIFFLSTIYYIANLFLGNPLIKMSTSSVEYILGVNFYTIPIASFYSILLIQIFILISFIIITQVDFGNDNIVKDFYKQFYIFVIFLFFLFYIFLFFISQFNNDLSKLNENYNYIGKKILNFDIDENINKSIKNKNYTELNYDDFPEKYQTNFQAIYKNFNYSILFAKYNNSVSFFLLKIILKNNISLNIETNKTYYENCELYILNKIKNKTYNIINKNNKDCIFYIKIGNSYVIKGNRVIFSKDIFLKTYDEISKYLKSIKSVESKLNLKYFIFYLLKMISNIIFYVGGIIFLFYYIFKFKIYNVLEIK